MRSRHTESSLRFDAKDHDRNSGVTTLEVLESGLRVLELDVGEWESASGTVLADAVKYTVMMNMAPPFLRNKLQLSTHANSAAL